MIKHYDFKVIQEALWAAVCTGGITVLIALVDLDLTKLADWHTYVIALLGSAIRAGAVAALQFLATQIGHNSDNKPVGEIHG